MTLKELAEIRGRWKPVGFCDKHIETYGKAGSSWREGSAILTSSDIFGLEWRLTNKSRKSLLRLKTRSDPEQVVLAADRSRLRVRCNDEGFTIITSNTMSIDDILAKVKATLATVSKKAGNERISADDALNSLLYDESDDDAKEMVIDDASPPSTPPHVAPRHVNSDIENKPLNVSHLQLSTPRKKLSCVFYPKRSSHSSPPRSATDVKPFYPNPGILLGQLAARHTALDSTPKSEVRARVPLKSPERSKLTFDQPVELHSDSDEDNQQVVGFSNLGNTCYMNVVWQCLLSLDTFTADLLHSCRKFEAKLEERSLLRCLSELAICKREKQMTFKDQKMLLKRISEVVAAKSNKYSNYRQHDAHEFFGDVIAWIKEETTLHSKKVDDFPTADRTSSAPREDINATVDNFEFKVETCLECTSCRHSSKKIETLNGLTVSIPETYLESNTKSRHRIDTYIQHALDSYFDPEVIDYVCEHCGATSFHSRQRITKLPRILALVARRYNSRGFSSKTQQKLYINKYIHLSNHCSGDTVPPTPPTTDVKLWSPYAQGLSMNKQKRTSNDVTPSAGVPAPSASTSAVADRPSAKKKLVLLPPERHPMSVVKVLRPSDVPTTPSRSFPFRKPSTLPNASSSDATVPRGACVSESTEFSDSDDDDLIMALKLSKEDALAGRREKMQNLTEQEQLDLALAQSLRDIDETVPVPSYPLSHSKLLSPQRNVKRKSLALISPNKANASGLRGGAATPPKLKKSPILSGDAGPWSSDETDSRKGSCHTPTKNKAGSVKAGRRLGARTQPSVKRLKRVLVKDSTGGVGGRQSKIGDHFSAIWSHTTGSKQSKPPPAKANSHKFLCSSDDDDCHVTSSTTSQIKSQQSASSTPKQEVVVAADSGLGQSTVSVTKKSPPQSKAQDVILWDSDDSLLMNVDSQRYSGDIERVEESKAAEGSTISADETREWLSRRSQNLPELEDAAQVEKQNGELDRSPQQDKENVEPEGNWTDNENSTSPTHNALPQVVLSLDEFKDLCKHNKDGSHFGYSYKLMGVVSHLGSKSTHGHYINDMYNIKDDSWLTYNDSRVTLTSVEGVCCNRVESGYMYFYMDSLVLREMKDSCTDC